jgi:flagellar basal-body rod protein FlgB
VPNTGGMSDISFGQTVGMLKNAMDGASSAHSVLANNIANLNTPNFRRSDVSFKEALAATDPSAATAPDELPLVMTNARDIPGNGVQPGQPFAITTSVDDTTQMRIDGSNVDVDQEMAKLSLNSGYAQTMAQLLTNQYTLVRKAISEVV